jgi:putrescine aminotransferase
VPVVDQKHIAQLYDEHVNRGLARVARQTGMPVEVRSAGCRVWDEAGREYLDCGGFGVFLLGHRHPAVLEALHQSLDRHPVATRALLSQELAEAAEALTAIAAPGLEYAYFGCTGSEVVETALKLARAHGRRRLIYMERGFHGKTLGALSVTDRPIARVPFRPLLPDTELVPFGEPEKLAVALADGEPACVIVEPVQGEGGVRIPPAGYLASVAKLCREHGAFLIVDEIQTGMGRLGKWWGCDYEDVKPDILLAGKGLGGGCVPVSAVIATEQSFAPFNRNPRLHSATFSGAPLLMAAVCATIETIRQEKLLDRARDLGAMLLAELRGIVAPYVGDLVTEVRGRGLLIGIELTHPSLANSFTAGLLESGVIVTNPVSSATVVRLSPPAILPDADAQWLTDAVRRALTALRPVVRE